MPVVSSFYGILIKMFFSDHAPLHFHAEYGEHSASVGIRDFAVLEGHLPPRALALVIEWASWHQEELLKNWNILSEGGDGRVSKIEPLQ